MYKYVIFFYYIYIQSCKKFVFYFVLRAYLLLLRVYSWLSTKGSFLVRLRNTYVMPGTEHRPAAYMTRNLSAVQSLFSQSDIKILSSYYIFHSLIIYVIDFITPDSDIWYINVLSIYNILHVIILFLSHIKSQIYFLKYCLWIF